ncbi:MAG: winged helix-turn-helix domain-containing protein [Desulfomonilaceae bacterium]
MSAGGCLQHSSTLMRWLHDEDFRLKVPRPWSDGQDEEERKALIELIKKLLGDQDVWIFGFLMSAV